MKKYDVVIIGGGPAGSMAALTAADLKLSVLLVERHNTIGNPVRCAEGVDEKGLREFFEPDPSWIATDINGYSLIAPDGTEVRMDMEGNKGYILERQIFDRMIAEEAAQKGAEIMTGVEAVEISDFNNGSRTVKLKSDNKEWNVKAKIVIAADGIESRVGRWAGLKTFTSLHDMESCAQVTLAGTDIDPNIFKIYFTTEFAPGGYVWIFPKGSGKANVGLGISGNFAAKKSPKIYLDEFLDRFFPNASIISKTYGGVSCSGGIKKLFADGLIIAGDSAHMANPITGGGIINALFAGKFAAQTASKALKKGESHESALSDYAKLCNKRFAKMNRKFFLLKEGIFNIPNNRLNDIAHEIANLPEEKRTPIRVLKSALYNQPKLLYVLAKVVF